MRACLLPKWLRMRKLLQRRLPLPRKAARLPPTFLEHQQGAHTLQVCPGKTPITLI